MLRIKGAARNAISLACYAFNRRPAGLNGKVALLMYHRVVAKEDLKRYYVQPGMYVLKHVFERQLSYLKKNFRILRLSELLDMWKARVWDNSERYCVITFDDGWLDNYNHAFPILSKYDIPATIFLPTSLMGTNHWFWPDKLGFVLKNTFSVESKLTEVLYDKWPWMRNHKMGSIDNRIDCIIDHVKQLPDAEITGLLNDVSALLNPGLPDERMLLSWPEIEEMSRHDISFGSHSLSHAILTKLTIEKVRIEMQSSLETLRQKNINHVPVFCYPNGNYTKEIVELAKSAGYSAAVTTRFGVENGSPQRMFELKRIGIHNDITSTVPLFAFHLSGLNDMLRHSLK